MRGFMLDSARALESREYYRQFIDFIATRGADTLLWHFTDDQGCALRFDAIPEAASPHAYTKEQMRALLRYAADRGVTVIPELETLGHSHYLTRGSPRHAHLASGDERFTSLCPVSAETREIVGTLLDEVMDLFDAPLIHVGLDEVAFGGHALTKQALTQRTAGDLYADYVRFLHARLAANGRRMMMWGDHLLHDPLIAASIPHDILVCNWQYGPDVSPRTTRTLIDWGFEVVLCPALISWHQPVYPGEPVAFPNLRSMMAHMALGDRVRGMIETIWIPTRFLPGSLWPAIAYAAAFMRNGDDVDKQACLRDFAVDFFGMSDTNQWVDAMTDLFEHAPPRAQWLATARLDDNETLQMTDLAGQTRATRKVVAALAEAKPQVTRNAASYTELRLLAEVLVHVSERARAYRAGHIDRDLVMASDQMAGRLSEAWDTARFHDDMRKTSPILPSDERHHLARARHGRHTQRRARHEK